jgi:hypothetical protein
MKIGANKMHYIFHFCISSEVPQVHLLILLKQNFIIPFWKFYISNL